MVRKEEVTMMENMRGGTGMTEIRRFLTEEELMGHADLFCRLVVHPHSSIGFHRHEHNAETFFVMKGTGVFIDDDGSRTEIHLGDVCTIAVSQCHGVENNSDENLEMTALILKEKVE